MSDNQKQSYFSVSFDFIVIDKPIPYDLYVNSSSRDSSEKFVRIFPIGEVMESGDVEKFKEKYHRLYIPESQRNFYLQSLGVAEDASEQVIQTKVIKDSAIKYLSKLFDPDTEFTTEVLNDTIKGCRESVSDMVDVIQDVNFEDLQDLIGKLSFHDFYTYDHSINVSMYCISILKAIKPDATKEEQILAGMSGMLHDLGKVKIPTDIINWPGKLTDEMFAEIKKHPGYGKDLLDLKVCACEGVDLKVVRRVVYEHHENFDGTGYPNKLSGEEIHMYARITAIADFFDAITTKRSYHDVMPIEDALNLMGNTKGKKLDPRLFDIFADNVETIIDPEKFGLTVPDDFDPCQPHDVIPLRAVVKETSRKKFDLSEEPKKDFGKIKNAWNNDDKKKPA